MVTTRQLQLDYILGNRTSVIPARELTVPEWEAIILAAADKLTLECLRGFKSVPQILEEGHNFFCAKPGRPPKNVDILFTGKQLLEANIRESDVWLPCVVLEVLPNPEAWPKKGEGYDVTTKSILLLKRHRRDAPGPRARPYPFEFFELSIDVQLMRSPDDQTVWDKEYWLKLVGAEFGSVELGAVLECLDQDQLLSSACTILLQQLVRAQTETFKDLAFRHDQSRRAKEDLEAFARRVGIA